MMFLEFVGLQHHLPFDCPVASFAIVGYVEVVIVRDTRELFYIIQSVLVILLPSVSWGRGGVTQVLALLLPKTG